MKEKKDYEKGKTTSQKEERRNLSSFWILWNLCEPCGKTEYPLNH